MADDCSQLLKDAHSKIDEAILALRELAKPLGCGLSLRGEDVLEARLRLIDAAESVASVGDLCPRMKPHLPRIDEVQIAIDGLADKLDNEISVDLINGLIEDIQVLDIKLESP